MAKGNTDPIFVDLGDGSSVSNTTESKNAVEEGNAEVIDTKPADIPEKKKPGRPRTGKSATEKQQDVSSNKTESETIDVQELKEETKSEKIVIDFMNAEESEKFIENKTKPTKDDNNESKKVEEEKSEFEGKSTEDIRKQILEEEEAKTNSFKPSDYEEVARMIVNVIDMLMSSLLKWWAKDTSDSAYSLNKEKKNTVSYQLTLIMIKHQKKWSIEFMFMLTIIAVYSGPALAARANRKKVKENEATKRGKGKPQRH